MSRKSKQKEAILRTLQNADCHPNADWIYDQVRREISNISLGTVYRDLKLLQKEGQILELAFNSHQSRFDGITKHHYHFRCEQCGLIVDVKEQVNIKNKEELAQKLGFQILHHNLEFCGLCTDCQSRDSEREDAVEKLKEANW
ncbi:transcriptional repressor [Chloroflexota bacterium]